MSWLLKYTWISFINVVPQFHNDVTILYLGKICSGKILVNLVNRKLFANFSPAFL